MARSFSGADFIGGQPKRTRIGNGRRVRTQKVTGRTKRSGGRKVYRGQGKG